MNIRQELIDEIESNCVVNYYVYRYFYNIFAKPISRDFIGKTSEIMQFFHDFTRYINNEETNNALALISEYVKAEEIACDIEKHIENINFEYKSLFLMGKMSVPMNASSYFANWSLKKQTEYSKVLKIYKRREFTIEDSSKSPDNIAVEIFYLHKLNELVLHLICEKNYKNILRIFEEEQSFTINEILTWVQEFTKKVVVASEKINSKLYPAIAMFVSNYLIYNIETLEELITELRKAKSNIC